jgi:hypothetical protein
MHAHILACMHVYLRPSPLQGCIEILYINNMYVYIHMYIIDIYTRYTRLTYGPSPHSRVRQLPGGVHPGLCGARDEGDNGHAAQDIQPLFILPPGQANQMG